MSTATIIIALSTNYRHQLKGNTHVHDNEMFKCPSSITSPSGRLGLVPCLDQHQAGRWCDLVPQPLLLLWCVFSTSHSALPLLPVLLSGVSSSLASREILRVLGLVIINHIDHQVRISIRSWRHWLCLQFQCPNQFPHLSLLDLLPLLCDPTLMEVHIAQVVQSLLLPDLTFLQAH